MQQLIKMCITIILLIGLSSCTNWQRNQCSMQTENFYNGNIHSFCPYANQDAAFSKEKYRVRGKTYRVLASSKNYEETGNASWYGKHFNRRRTYSGERFNMHSMTAAHKTLPIATRVQVTNLLNGRKVIVRVNDRGPFVNNRLIDLSYVAAKKLGMIGHGIVPVNVKALNA